MADAVVNSTGNVEQLQDQTTGIEQVVNQPVQTNTPVTEIEIDGLGRVKVDEIKEWKQGALRQSDYTRKTQEIAKQRSEMKDAMEVYNYLKANPTIAQQIVNGETVNTVGTPMQNVNPYSEGLKKVEYELATLKLDSEISRLKTKYNDFDEVSVLQKADELGMADLEFVYKGMRGESVNTLEQQIEARVRAELTNKIRQNAENTTTIISGGDQTQNIDSGLSQEEILIATKLGVSPAEYAKYK